MNLINDAWIPVRKKTGEKVKIAPWQITECIGTEKEITELAAPRPDFNGALIQFLIGLLQTTCAPQNTGEWRKWLNNPPKLDLLKERFKEISYAFNLDGDGQRFMQETGLKNANKKKEETIDKIFIDMPGEQTLRFNTDHFVKRGALIQICLNCTATALFTLQVNAPLGGQGHLTGLRGGGPLTTLIHGDNIWNAVWMNILETSNYYSMVNSKKAKDDDKFPWLSNGRNSEKGLKTTPQDIHPAQLYWAMPRRILLQIEISPEKKTCDLCGEQSEQIAKKYFTKTRGIDYKGAWKHPLSPMYLKTGNADQEMWLAVHQHGHIGYRHWLGYVLNDADKKRPALVVSSTLNRGLADFRLWAFGYDMDNMKASCWHEGTMPIRLAEKEQREAHSSYVVNLIKTADKVSNDLAWHIKAGLYDVTLDANKKKDFSPVKDRFWESTEPMFYNTIEELREFMAENENQLPEKILLGWLNFLIKTAAEIFDDIAQSGEFNAGDPARVATAWNRLKWRIYSDETKNILGLPVEDKKAKRR